MSRYCPPDMRPEARFTQVAAILAAGYVKLRSQRPSIAMAKADDAQAGDVGSRVEFSTYDEIALDNGAGRGPYGGVD